MIAHSLINKMPIPNAHQIALEDSGTFRRRQEYEEQRCALSTRGYTVVILSPKGRRPNSPAVVELPQRLRRLRHHIRRTDFIGWYDSGQAIGILFTDIAKDQQSTCNRIFEEKLAAVGFGTDYQILQLNSWSSAKTKVAATDLGRALTPAEFAVRLREEYRRYLRDGVGYTVSKRGYRNGRLEIDKWAGTISSGPPTQCEPEAKATTWSLDGNDIQVLLLHTGSTDADGESVVRLPAEGPKNAQRIAVAPCSCGAWRRELAATRKVYENGHVAAHKSAGALFAKRLLDILGSGIGLLIGAPLFLILAAGVKLSSPGPVLFRQKRVGQYGKEFTFLKFRSMKHGNDASIHEKFVADLMALQAATEGRPGASGNPIYKMVNDTRITWFGALIRKTSLDELPQLINVLRGDMSLVGPRPPIPYEVDLYAPWHLERLIECKPGITGLWQVEGRSRVSFNEMVRMDLRYARDWSLLLDIQLLIRTIGIVFRMTGAR